MQLQTLTIHYVAVDALKSNKHNARRHSGAQIGLLASAIGHSEVITPLLVDENLVLIAGHGRLEAARQLGIAEVPVIVLSHLDDAHKRALLIADNAVVEKGGWDVEILREELLFLSSPDIELLDGTGMTSLDVDILTIDTKSDKSDPDDQVPAIDRTVPSIAQPGQLWQLGTHRIACGDSRDSAVLDLLMAGEPAKLVLQDPPYNVKIKGHVSGLGALKHDEFAMASGEMTDGQFETFLGIVLQRATSHCVDGAVIMSFIDWRHLETKLRVGRGLGFSLLNVCVWDKTSGGMGSLYRSQHELVVVFKHGSSPHVNNVQLGKNGRYRTNVWKYPGANMFRKGRQADLAMHPTVKPVGLLADAIMDCTNRGDVVLDPFGGSGSTLMAAERTGRRARLTEIDPYYVDVTVRRWEERTGQKAVVVECRLEAAA